MAEIDVLVTFDAETIYHNYGGNTDSGNPVSVSNDLIYMVTAQDDALNGNGGGELTIYAQTEDTIRWREATPSPDYSAILYRFTTDSTGLITPPVALEAPVTVPLPDPDNPTVPLTQTIQDYFWNSTVIAPGSVTYHFAFMLVSRHGDVLGYYQWDPFISITS
jgi:nematocidal protein AidA